MSNPLLDPPGRASGGPGFPRVRALPPALPGFPKGPGAARSSGNGRALARPVPYPRRVIELQSHSTISDGQLPPAEVVEQAAGAGVEVLALTDHDGVAGVAEAVEAGERLGVEVVPAIEMSAANEMVDDLHVCGYWVDPEVPKIRVPSSVVCSWNQLAPEVEPAPGR